MVYTSNDDDHKYDGDENHDDDNDDDDHRLTSVIIGSNGRPWKIFTRALIAAFAGRAVWLTFWKLYVEICENFKILGLPVSASILARPMAVVQQALVHIETVALEWEFLWADEMDDDHWWCFKAMT